MFGVAQAQERVINRGVINHREENGEGDPDGGPTRNNSGFGVKGGVLFSQLRGNGKDIFNNLKSETNWHAGFYAQFSLGNVVSLQPEVLYSRKGAKMDNAPDLRFDYIEVPVLAVVNFTDNLSFHVGPQVGLMVSAKQDNKEQDLESYNTFDYGGTAGLEARVGIFRLGARYYLSLTDIGDFDNTATAQNRALNDIKNGNFQVYVGFGF